MYAAETRRFDDRGPRAILTHRHELLRQGNAPRPHRTFNGPTAVERASWRVGLVFAASVQQTVDLKAEVGGRMSAFYDTSTP